MSEITSRSVQSNFATFDRTVEKLFLFENDYITGTFLNNTGATIELVGGEVIGRVAASGKLVVLTSAAVDGSTFVVGINRTEVTVLNAAEAPVLVCVQGWVNEDLLILQGSDTLSTVIELRQIRDKIMGETMGIKIVKGEELTKYDN